MGGDPIEPAGHVLAIKVRQAPVNDDEDLLNPMVLSVVLAANMAHGVTAFAAPGDAERPASAPEITSTGSCPSADAIWTAMASLVPSGALEALPRTAAVDVSDAGETYRVRLTV